MGLGRRDEWNRVLAMELERWAAKAWPQIVSDLGDGNVAYEVEFEGKQYQVEANLLENTDAHVHISIAVDDGSLSASIFPASQSLIRKKIG